MCTREDDQVLEDLIQYFDALSTGIVVWDNDTEYHVDPFPETVEEVVDYAVNNISPVVEDGKMVFEVAQFKEDKAVPMVKFIPNTIDYRLLNWTVEDVFDEDSNVIVSTPVAKHIVENPGGLMYNKGSTNKDIKKIQQDLVEFIHEIPGKRILVHGRFAGLSVALSYNQRLRQRYFFSGIGEEVIDKIFSYDNLYGGEFFSHYRPPEDAAYDYVVIVNGNVMNHSKKIFIQFIGDGVTSEGNGSNFTYKGINYPSCDGSGFMSLSLFFSPKHSHSKYIYVKGLDPIFNPVVEPYPESMYVPLFAQRVGDLESRPVVRGRLNNVIVNVPDGWYACQGDGKIVFPLDVQMVKLFVKNTANNPNVVVWTSKVLTGDYYYVDSGSYFGLVRNGVLHDSVYNVGVKGYLRRDPHKDQDVVKRWNKATGMSVSDIYKKIMQDQSYKGHEAIVRYGGYKSLCLLYEIGSGRNKRYVFSPAFLKIVNGSFTYMSEKYDVVDDKGFCIVAKKN